MPGRQKGRRRPKPSPAPSSDPKDRQLELAPVAKAEPAIAAATPVNRFRVSRAPTTGFVLFDNLSCGVLTKGEALNLAAWLLKAAGVFDQGEAGELMHELWNAELDAVQS